jgi:hypothetical protein
MTLFVCLYLNMPIDPYHTESRYLVFILISRAKYLYIEYIVSFGVPLWDYSESNEVVFLATIHHY